MKLSMCGIFALIENENTSVFDEDIKESTFKLLEHRGPDTQGELQIETKSKKVLNLVHTRLKINGNNTPQPLTSNDGTIVLIINGEIFNWKELSEELDYTCTKSDCEIVFPLYQKYKNDIPTLLNKLNGQFSLFLYDKTNDHILIARDPIGVTPLYYGYKVNTYNNNGNSFFRFGVSSELKCLTQDIYKDTSLMDTVKVFYPRTYIYTHIDNRNYIIEDYTDFYDINSYDINSYHNSYKINFNQEFPVDRSNMISTRETILRTIKQLLTNSVRSQLTDLIEQNVSFGVLLSGGLDSSLIASLVVKLSRELGYNHRIKTFSVGVNRDVPDLVAARRVAEFLGTDHTEYYFTIEEGIEAIPKVIWHIESYDCTSVRASTPMFLLTKSIKQEFPDIKVLFSGELSDELLCYLYGANAPSESDFQTETINLVSNVHLFDCLRANKTCMANSLEVRVPFTDIKFVEYILSLHPRWKVFGELTKTNGMKEINVMEKQILRDAFVGSLPEEILYRKKEQFSDGVSGFDTSTNWIDSVKKYTSEFYDDPQFISLSDTYNYNKPDTKEKLYYREIFCKLFSNKTKNKITYKNTSELTVKSWKPKWSETDDPSGRVQSFWNGANGPQ